MKHPKRFILIALACLAAPAGALANVTFTDSTFALANYNTVLAYSADSSNSYAISQCPSCGNPGLALEIIMNEPDGGGATSPSLYIGVINTTFAYDPATNGAITSISASIDKNITDNAVGTLGNFFRPIIEQDGNIYVYEVGIAGPSLSAPGTTGYNTLAGTDLTAAEFVEINTTTGAYGTANPNFDGDLMKFGFAQLLGPTTVTGTVVTYYFDNLSIGLTTTVPEPATLSLLGLGLAGVGFMRRRRAS